MKNSLPVSVVVAARNEEKNIRKCLDSLQPASEILLIDSGSEDETASIAAEEYGAKVHQFQYSGAYPKKRQWALDNLEILNDWIFLVDADEEVTPALWEEIGSVVMSKEPKDAYLITKRFHFLGRCFRYGGFSHSAVLLFRKGRARFEELFDDLDSGLDMEVHERICVEGTTGRLKEHLNHEDYKGLAAYLDRHNRYSTWEANLRYRCLSQGAYGSRTIEPSLFGNAQERRRFLKTLVMKLPFEPFIWFVYHYLFCLGFLEGWSGFVASRIRAQYIFQVRAKLLELQRATSREG
jgi:glycosyltransferase involved in cell wall biosynthesis